MTVEQQEQLERELKGAMDSGDHDRIRCAHSNIMLALVDCQRKTAERVKQLLIDADRAAQRRKGAVAATVVIWSVTSALVGAGVMKIIGGA